MRRVRVEHKMSISGLEIIFGGGCLTLFVTPVVHCSSSLLLRCIYVAYKNLPERGPLPLLKSNLAPFTYANLINGKMLFSQQLH